MVDPTVTPSAGGPASEWRRIFVGPNGARAGWRLLLYSVMVVILAVIVLRVLMVMARAHLIAAPTPASTSGFVGPRLQLVVEIAQFIFVAIPALIMAKIERRPFGDYGLPLQRRALRSFAIGAVWGIALISVVIGGIAILHGYDLGRLALTGPAIAKYAFAWLAVFLVVGLFEEFAFRGYTQFTLATGIGFWPAAILLSAGFGAAHLGNGGEDYVGALQVFLIAMFFALTLRRTGSLWFAVGAHATFDWGETFLYSVPNSGLVATGHLTASSLHGPTWLTGGTVGPEASVACFVAVALSIALFAWLTSGTRAGSI